jgi:ABC-type Mn2+/Zn2+ transport system permease subunit
MAEAVGKSMKSLRVAKDRSCGALEFCHARYRNRPHRALGVVFAGSLAVGAALTPKEDLVEALFGSFQTLSLGAFLIGSAAVLLIIFIFVIRFKEQLLLGLFSPDLAAAAGVRLERLNLSFLLVFTLTVPVGLRSMGAFVTLSPVCVPTADCY